MTLPNGYTMTTTFFEDFSIADAFGASAIRDTFNRSFKHWKHDAVYLTELVIALNLKIWQWYEKGNKTYANLYNTLWEKADEYACENLKGEDLDFFYRTTD